MGIHSHHGKILVFCLLGSDRQLGNLLLALRIFMNKSCNSNLITNNFFEASCVPGIVKRWRCVHSPQHPCSTRPSVCKIHCRSSGHVSLPAVWSCPPLSPQIHPWAPEQGRVVRPSYQRSLDACVLAKDPSKGLLPFLFLKLIY